MIEMSIIEYFAGDYSGNIIYPFPNSVKTLIILARCNHCISKTAFSGDHPGLETPPTFIPTIILRGAMAFQSKVKSFCGHPVDQWRNSVRSSSDINLFLNLNSSKKE